MYVYTSTPISEVHCLMHMCGHNCLCSQILQAFNLHLYTCSIYYIMYIHHLIMAALQLLVMVSHSYILFLYMAAEVEGVWKGNRR